MIRKKISEFTEDEKNWMNTLAVNYILAQSDGYQLGYAQAVSDLTEYISDYWNGSDDKPQKSVLDTLVDLGVELGRRRTVAENNIKQAKEEGYEQRYGWKFKSNGEPYPTSVRLFTKEFASDNTFPAEEQKTIEHAATSEETDLFGDETESIQIESESVQNEPESVQNEPESVRNEPESVQNEQENAQNEQKSDHTAADEGDGPQAEEQEAAPMKNRLGKWEEYIGRALSTLEQNLIIKGMTEEDYSLSQIARVVRLSQPTICNRKKKLREAGELA